MSDVVAALEVVRLLVFASAGLAGGALWWRRRTRPAAFLAATFGLLAIVLLASRLIPEASGSTTAAVGRDLVIIGLALFPWLLAAFAWSFDTRFPLWLVAAAGAIVVVTIWVLVLPSLPPAGEPRTANQQAFVVVFIAGWSALTIVTAVKLWRTGGRQPLVRARMRLMAGGAVVLTTALLVAGNVSPEALVGQVVIHLLAIGSAILFTVGFAPPPVVRMWWRRRATAQWQDVQARLIAAVTPEQVADAVVPMLADVLGAGAAVLTADGDVLAAAGLTDHAQQQLVARFAMGIEQSPGEHWVPVNGACLVVTATPYTPLFGADERDIITGNALQLRLALERAELFARNDRARRVLESQHAEMQAMLAGLAHDIAGPLSAIGGFVDILREEDDPAADQDMLARIEANVGHLSALSDAVVALSRAGQAHPNREPVDLNLVVTRAAARVHETHPGLAVQTHPLPTVQANPLAMEQLFHNLLHNAARHGGRDTITVTIEPQPAVDATVIDIIDDGQGLPADDREAVFAPFRRGRHTTNAGSGIGLGLVRRITHGHGGNIELLDSEQGAHFRLHLPADTDHE